MDPWSPNDSLKAILSFFLPVPVSLSFFTASPFFLRLLKDHSFSPSHRPPFDPLLAVLSQEENTLCLPGLLSVVDCAVAVETVTTQRGSRRRHSKPGLPSFCIAFYWRSSFGSHCFYVPLKVNGVKMVSP